MQWVYLGIAILGEVVGTSALKAADGFTRPGPALITVAGFAVALFFLGLSLRTVPIGIAYAIWSGLGIVLISAIGFAWYGQALDRAALAGIGLILAGVLVIQLFSDSVRH